MKSRHIKLLAVLVFFSMVFSSCWLLGPTMTGNGNVTEEVRQLREFDEIEVSRGMNVYITQGSPAKVVVVADNNLHDVIITDVDGDVLKVYVEANIRRATEKKVVITIDKLTKVKTTSGSNVYTQGRFTAKNMELTANSGSNMTMDFNAEHLEAGCSSGSNIMLSGEARESVLEASSGANLKARELKSEKCSAKASSGANVFATVLNQLNAKASSGGNVIYSGEPATKDFDTSSGGNVSQR